MKVIKFKAFNPRKQEFVHFSVVGNNEDGYSPIDWETGELCEIVNLVEAEYKEIVKEDLNMTEVVTQ